MLSFLSLSTVIGGERPRQDLQHLRLVLTNHQGCIYLLRRLTGKSQPPLTLLVPGGCAQCSVFAVVIFEGHLRLFLNKIRPTPLVAPSHPAPRFGPFFRLVRGSRAAVAPQIGQGGLGGPQNRHAYEFRVNKIGRMLFRTVYHLELVCRRSMAVGVISARMSPVGITVGSEHAVRLSLSARLLLTAIR